MNPFVIDSSVILAWLLGEESSGADAIILRLATTGAVAPSLWPYEVANALVVAERRGRITAALASRAAELAKALPIHSVDRPAEVLLDGVRRVAREHGLSVYDGAYLELALAEALPLATFDGALARAAKQAGVHLVA